MSGPDMSPEQWADARRDALALAECAERAHLGLATHAEAVSDALVLMEHMDDDRLRRVAFSLAVIVSGVVPPRPGWLREWLEGQAGGDLADG